MCDIIRHVMDTYTRIVVIYGYELAFTFSLFYCCDILLRMTSWTCACIIVYRITRQIVDIYACHCGIEVHVRYMHTNCRDVYFYLSWTRTCISVTLWTCTCVSMISCYTLWTYTCDSVIITIRYGHVHVVM